MKSFFKEKSTLDRSKYKKMIIMLYVSVELCAVILGTKKITLRDRDVGRDVGSGGSLRIPFICRILSSKELCLFTCSAGRFRVAEVGPL